MASYGSIPAHVQNHEAQMWGSEGVNIKQGYRENKKGRWQQMGYQYQDVGALDTFGVLPMKPPGPGVVMTSDGYGYPVDGYTTGYTTKLPPPANLETALKLPRGSNQISVVAASDGYDGVSPIPSSDPVNYVNWWRYGDAAQQAELEQIRAIQAASRVYRKAGVSGAAARGTGQKMLAAQQGGGVPAGAA